MEGGAGVLSDSSDCGRVLIRLLSRGHAIVAELQCVADGLPATLRGEGLAWKRLAAVLPDFSVFRGEGALESVANAQELIELDEESRELHVEIVARIFYTLAAIRRFAENLRGVLNDLEAGAYISHSLETVVRDPDGVQLLSEAIALLGTMLLLVEERLPGPARERALVAFHRFTVGTSDASDEFPDVCRLFRSARRPADHDMAKREAGYPEAFFARFQLPSDAIRIVIGQLQTRDVYDAVSHYPLPEHRSQGLAAQAGLLYVILFFDVETLTSDVVAMREIVNRHFADAWVIAFALGFTADLFVMWAPYAAARDALHAALTPATVKHLRDRHFERLAATMKQLADYLTEGALTEEVVSQKAPAFLNCLRQANTSIRWLLLQPTTIDPTMQALVLCSSASKEKLLQSLVDTALLEERVRGLLAPLVARRETDWLEYRAKASQAMDDLAVYFSGDHALRRNVRNEELEQWFRGLQARIDELVYSDTGGEETLSLGRKISQLLVVLEEVEQFHEISEQLQILHFLHDARDLLQKMVRTVNLRQEMLGTISKVADLSYAWNALGGYQQSMHALLAKSPNSVKGLRALFLKLASILETPLKRIRQAKNQNHEELVAAYYSRSLMEFMQRVLQEIPRLIFGFLRQISEQRAARPQQPWPSRVPLAELQAYAERSEGARDEVGKLTQKIALLMRGIRETDAAVFGALSIEPRCVLVRGLRHELAHNVSDLFAGLVFSSVGRALSRQDFVAPLSEVAAQAQYLSQAFEHVQDYLGVSALQMWHGERARITGFVLYMELHVHLRRKLPLASSSRHHDAECPIEFPDKVGANGATGVVGGKGAPTKHGGAPLCGGASFLSRTVEAMLALSDPKVAVRGLSGEWRAVGTGEVMLDTAAFELLHAALGAPAVVALSRLLGFQVALRLRWLFSKLSKGLKRGTEQAEVLQKVAAQVCCRGGGTAEAVRALRAIAQSSTGSLNVMSDTLASVGQLQMLRRCLHDVLRVHSRLDAPLTSQALGTLDAAGLVDAFDSMNDVETSALPSVWDFVHNGPPAAEILAFFQRRVAHAGEQSGHGEPFRQLYVAVAPFDLPQGIDVLLALTLLSATECRATVRGGGASGKTKRTSLRALVSRPQRQSTANDGLAVHLGNSDIVLAAGVATLLQQLPLAVTNSVLELCGLCLGSLCVEGTAGREASWADGACLIDFLGNALELLGLSRGQLAVFVSQELLDLWPPPD